MCVFPCIQLPLCFQTRLPSFLFLYSNFAHTNVKQQLFGQHFKKAASDFSCLNSEARISTLHGKKGFFSPSYEAVDIFTCFFCKCGNVETVTPYQAGVSLRFPLSERKCQQCLSQPGYSELLLLQLSRSKPVMCQSLP